MENQVEEKHESPFARLTNELNGLRESWYDNGQLESRANYKGGKRDGLVEEWHDNGKPWEMENYKDGELDGFIDWWHNGQLKINSKIIKTE